MNKTSRLAELTARFLLRLCPVALALAAGCSSPGVVFMSRGYNPAQTRRVALLNFADYPGAPGSGEIAAGIFEKYLLWADYNLIERRHVTQILKEQSLNVSGAMDQSTIRNIGRIIGVDAVAFGTLTDFSHNREQTVMVDIPQQQSEPVYGQVVTVQQSGGGTVSTTQNVITGYTTRQTSRVVPEVRTFPAKVGMAVRLVDVQTSEVLWSASTFTDGSSLTTATEEASSKIMLAVVNQLKKLPSP